MPSPDVDFAALRTHVRGYAGADDRLAWRTLASTFAGYAAVVALYLAGSWPLAMLLSVGVLVRTFVVYHDGIHRSFFKSRAWNDRLATCLRC